MTIAKPFFDLILNEYYPELGPYELGVHTSFPELANPAEVTAEQLDNSLQGSWEGTCSYVGGSPFELIFRASVTGASNIPGIAAISVKNTTLGLYLNLIVTAATIVVPINSTLEFSVFVPR
jgi:hypothetical protein